MLGMVLGAFLAVVVLVASLVTGTPAALILLVPCLAIIGLSFGAEVWWLRRQARRDLSGRGQEG